MNSSKPLEMAQVALSSPTGGMLPVRVSRLEAIAADVVAISLGKTDGTDFPEWSAGAHIDVLIDGALERQYSLCGRLEDRTQLRIAVLRDPASRGGSQALHEKLHLGDTLFIRAPRNNFPLVDADETIFIAGGIGITPIHAMIAELEREGKPWKLLYGGRSRATMAFRDELAEYGEDRVQIQPEDEAGLLDIAAWIGEPRPACAIYCCGPERLIAAVENACVGWPEDALHVERFRPADGALEGKDEAFEVVLARKGISIEVAPGQAIADALEAVGVHIPRSCNEGTCGTCITKVLEGTPDHRDSFLRGRMRSENKKIMVCCSRALSARLILDI